MKAVNTKIDKAKESLSYGIHDPVLMEEIDVISEILKKWIVYKKKLKISNMDVD